MWLPELEVCLIVIIPADSDLRPRCQTLSEHGRVHSFPPYVRFINAGLSPQQHPGSEMLRAERLNHLIL